MKKDVVFAGFPKDAFNWSGLEKDQAALPVLRRVLEERAKA